MVGAMFTRGAILGRKYTIEETLGEGPTGPIFAAEERFRERRVAVKIVRLPPSIKRRQFGRDADALQSVRSENVIFVHDVGALEEALDEGGEPGAPYIVMELLEGRNLAELIAESGPIPLPEAIAYTLQACNGLKELHAARIVHRHVKASNLFLTKGPDGQPLIKLLDIGLSSIELAVEAGSEAELDAPLLDSLKYASPERLATASRVGPAAPASGDARTDIWSLAVTLYVLATGKHPFEGTTAAEVRDAITQKAHAKLMALVPDAQADLGHVGRVSLAELVDRVLERALAKPLESRTASIADFARELELCLAPASPVAEIASPPAEASVPEAAVAVVPPEAVVAVVPVIIAPVVAIGPAEAPRTELPPREDPPAPKVDARAFPDLDSDAPVSGQPDATAPGATTPLPSPSPVASQSSRALPARSLRWLALGIAAILLLGGISLFRSGPSRGPSVGAVPREAAPAAPTVSAVAETESTKIAAPDPAIVSPAIVPLPKPEEQETPPALEAQDAGASPHSAPPRRSRRR